jgi:hypothetical protein
VVCPLLFHNLLAGNTASYQAAPVADDALIASAQSLFDQVKADMNLSQGEVIMFIPDMPNVPPQNVPVMIAQANQAQPSDTKTTRTLGVCYPVPNDSYSLENVLGPTKEAQAYLREYEHQTVKDPATITVIQQPKHGILRLVTEADRGALFDSSASALVPSAGLYAYLPEKGYLGKDKAVMLVEIAGVKVKVVYFFQAIGGGLGSYGIQEYCGKTGPYWKISTILDPNGTSTITSVEYQSPITSAADTALTDTAALASTLGSSLLRNNRGQTTFSASSNPIDEANQLDLL